MQWFCPLVANTFHCPCPWVGLTIESCDEHTGPRSVLHDFLQALLIVDITSDDFGIGMKGSKHLSKRGTQFHSKLGGKSNEVQSSGSDSNPSTQFHNVLQTGDTNGGMLEHKGRGGNLEGRDPLDSNKDSIDQRNWLGGFSDVDQPLNSHIDVVGKNHSKCRSSSRFDYC